MDRGKTCWPRNLGIQRLSLTHTVHLGKPVETERDNVEKNGASKAQKTTTSANLRHVFLCVCVQDSKNV